MEHEIQMEGPPVRVPIRRQNLHVGQEEDRQVQQILQQRIIRPSTSSWVTAAVVAKKKNDTKRFCVEYRLLNNTNNKDAHHLPRIDGTLDVTTWSQDFLYSHEHDKHKTAFITSSGKLMACKVMPYGLCNAAATFSRLMDQILSCLAWEVCIA